MNEPAEVLDNEVGSVLAELHARAGHRCELCEVKNFAIGGRDGSGKFHPIYQERPNPIEARQKIGRRAWCGVYGPEHLLVIQRIVCEVVLVRTDACGDSDLLLCGRCAQALRKTGCVVEVP